MARNFVFACFVLLAFSLAFRAQMPVALSKSAGGMTIEKYVANYEVNADGTCTQIVETDRRLNSKAFAEKLKRYELQFNSGLQEIDVLESAVIKPDGKRINLPPDAIQIKPTAQAEAAPMFSSLKVLTVDFDALEIGDTTHLKLRFKLIKPLIENQFSAVEIFPTISQWKSIEINVSAPKSFPLEFEPIGLAGGKVNEENSRVFWQWKAKIETPVGYENGALNYTDFSPRLAISSFKNYEQLGAAYWANAKDKTALTPEIQKLADEITAGLIEPKAQAEVIYRWVNKNIRYLLIFLGRDGVIPRDAKTTLANRYGDCKDYTNLIQTLLKAKGIESVPVLIHADTNYWLPKIPVSDYFNHAILYIPSLDAYADATTPHTRLGLIPQVLVGKTALLAGEKTGLIKIPDGKPEDNKFQTATVINLQPDGSLKANVKNTYQGTLEMIYRSLFADSEAVKSEMFFRGAYAYYGYSGNGKIVKASNPFQTNEPFTIEVEANLDNYISFARRAGFKIPAAITLNNLLDLEKLVSLPQRKTPLLTGAIDFDENFQINFPDGVKIESLPMNLNFKNAAGTYQSVYRQENNSVTIKRELIIRKDVFQPEEYQAARELIQKAVSDVKTEIRLFPTKDFGGQKALAKSESNGKYTDPTSAMSEAMDNINVPIITAQRAIQLEAALKQNPNDAQLRKRLIHFYSNAAGDFSVKNTWKLREQKQKNVFEHYKWFVQNHPELSRKEVGLSATDLSVFNVRHPQYQELKSEWLKQVELRKGDSVVRLNAVDFFYLREWQVTENLLLEGEKIDAENYKLPLKLIEIYDDRFEESESDAERKALLVKIFEHGERTLTLLKQERTEARDIERENLLLKLAKSAFELGNFEKAKAYATELILEFSDNSNDVKYAEAVHTGNIILGKVALSENNLAKAKEYLLIAARAPQHAHFKAIFPDLELARMLLAKEEKLVVMEYLKLCENLNDVNVKMLQRWQREIAEGKIPSLSWSDFEMKIEAQFRPYRIFPRRKS